MKFRERWESGPAGCGLVSEGPHNNGVCSSTSTIRQPIQNGLSSFEIQQPVVILL